MTKHNDFFKDYLKNLIRVEKMKINATKKDGKVLFNLLELLKNYEERAEKMEKDMEMEDDKKNLEPNDILDLIEELYELKLVGKDIKKSAESTYIGNQRNHIYLEKPLPIDQVSLF